LHYEGPPLKYTQVVTASLQTSSGESESVLPALASGESESVLPALVESDSIFVKQRVGIQAVKVEKRTCDV
jgi:arginine repressor